MTIQVRIKHGDAGHPAPLYVTPVDPDTGKLGFTSVVHDRTTLIDYIHQHKSLLVSERPPAGSQGVSEQMTAG